MVVVGNRVIRLEGIVEDLGDGSTMNLVAICTELSLQLTELRTLHNQLLELPPSPSAAPSAPPSPISSPSSSPAPPPYLLSSPLPISSPFPSNPPTPRHRPSSGAPSAPVSSPLPDIGPRCPPRAVRPNRTEWRASVQPCLAERRPSVRPPLFGLAY